MYLKEIGRVPLLTAAQEIDLARRIEAGETVSLLTESPTADSKPFRKIVEMAVGVRTHQLTAFGRFEGIGREAVTKSWKPKSKSEHEGFLRRVERDGQLAKKKLIEANLRLVVSIAKRYVGRGMLFLDLIQEGNLGLIRAVEKFDYRKGFKFSTYATWWIRQAITRSIADQARTIRIPVHMVETINRLIRVSRGLLQELGREPTVEEIAEAMSKGQEVVVTPEKVREIIKVSQEPVSLETPIGEEEDSHLGDFIEDRGALAPAEAASHQLLKEQVEAVLDSLTGRERRVLQLRFGLEDGRARGDAALHQRRQLEQPDAGMSGLPADPSRDAGDCARIARQHQQVARSGEAVDAHVRRHLPLGLLHVQVARPDDHIDRRDRVGAPHRGSASHSERPTCDQCTSRCARGTPWACSRNARWKRHRPRSSRRSACAAARRAARPALRSGPSRTRSH